MQITASELQAHEKGASVHQFDPFEYVIMYVYVYIIIYMYLVWSDNSIQQKEMYM